jgi:hypothetical protein
MGSKARCGEAIARKQGGEARAPDAPQPEQVQVWEDPFHVLHLRVGERQFDSVRAVRVFPVSRRADYVSFLDEAGKEVFLLAHPQKLDKASRRALDKALEHMYYVAKILRVFNITETMGVTHWLVLTDRGYAAFEVVDRQLIRQLPHDRYIITDADGNRFEIDDLSKLDTRSQTLVFSET